MTPDRAAGRLAACISPACTGAGPGDRSSATPITDRVVGSLIMPPSDRRRAGRHASLAQGVPPDPAL